MIIQEQSSSGTGGSITGTEPGYEGYYNFFNIEVIPVGQYVCRTERTMVGFSVRQNTETMEFPEKSILGGALYYGNNYVKVGQDTFYLKKFNVQGNNLYKHQ